MLACVALYFTFGKLRGSEFQWSLLFATLGKVHPGWLAASVGTILVTYFGRALRWRVMLRPLKAHPSLWGLTIATAIGFTAIVLFGRPGEMVRPYLIAVKERVTFASQIAAWFLERVYDLLMVLLVFGFALSQMRGAGKSGLGPGLTWVLKSGGYIVGVLGVLCLLILFGFRRFGPVLEDRIRETVSFLPEAASERIAGLLTAFRSGMATSGDARYVSELLAYTIAEWIAIVGGMAMLFRAFPGTESFSTTDIIVFIGFVSFGSAIQIPGVGGGMQVAAVLVLTEFFGMDLEPAAAFAILIWVTTYVAILPFGLIAAVHEGVKWRSLKRITLTKEAE